MVNKRDTEDIKSVFQRFNTFGYQIENPGHYAYYHSFYHTIRSYALHANLKMFDSEVGFENYCKPLDLLAAKQHGLKIPLTLLTDNEIPKSR